MRCEMVGDVLGQPLVLGVGDPVTWDLGPGDLGPGAWGLGTGYFNSAGCWEKKLPYEGMSREVEAEGFDALDAAMGNFLYKNCAWRYPHIIEGKELGDVSENVRQAIA